MPAPSPRTNPLADASKAAHRPSGESIAACENPINPPGVIITVTPPAKSSISASGPDVLARRMNGGERG